jgi:hypothetical protein
MTSISTMMEDRAAIDAQIEAIPLDLSSEQEFKDAFDRKRAVERAVLECQALTLTELKQQIKILAQRARDVGDAVAEELERLAPSEKSGF